MQDQRDTVSIFKSGILTKEGYTRAWIELICAVERSKGETRSQEP